MKNGIILLLSGMLGSLVLVIVMTICGNMSRSVELQENLPTAVEASVKNLSGQEEPCSAKMLAECIERMSLAPDSNTEVTVKVYQVDAGKGILSLCTTGMYLHPNGMRGDTECKRTVIYDKREKTEKMELHEVSFYLSKEDLVGKRICYKRYSVKEGECIACPTAPQKEDKVFAGWRDDNDYLADFSQPVNENFCYYAAWE